MFCVVAFDRRLVRAALSIVIFSVRHDDRSPCVGTATRLYDLSCGQQEVTVAPVLSTARYKYFQEPLTFT